MLIEAVGLIAILAGFFAFAAACAWSIQTLRRDTGSFFNISVIAGAFVFYNLIVKIYNGDAAFHNYVIGLAAVGVIALDAWGVREKYGTKTALARVWSSVLGALILAMVAMFLCSSGGKKRDDNKK